MKINELYSHKFVISFEIFPPKTPAGEEKLMQEMEKLSAYKPDFVSVTYGAGGSTREKTLDIALKIRNDYAMTPLVHFTCVGTGKKEIQQYLNRVKQEGIENILALRGDPPAGETSFRPHPEGFSYANELITYIREINGFTIAAAGYPEGHTEAPSFSQDMDNLKRKVDAGANLIITQLFYNNEDYYNFMNEIDKRNITVPVVPGIMPVTSMKGVEKITSLCGAAIPEKLKNTLQCCSDEEGQYQAGLEYSIRQCEELKSWGVPGFHIYTVNKSATVIQIMDALKLGNSEK
jgi:methylenetetrahydrofolate reductase (NADPH)